LKAQQEELNNLRETMRVQLREYKDVRAISQVIIDQKSDVEQFFLEALEQIKEEIKKKLQTE